MDEIVKIIDSYLNDIDNSKQIDMFYEIGKKINDLKINKKDLELFIRGKYGLSIAFTDRNLSNMVKFSKYDKKLLNQFEQITWKNILVIMKYDISLIDICLKYKPTKYELLDYINNKKIKKNDIIEEDDTLIELKNMIRSD